MGTPLAAHPESVQDAIEMCLRRNLALGLYPRYLTIKTYILIQTSHVAGKDMGEYCCTTFKEDISAHIY